MLRKARSAALARPQARERWDVAEQWSSRRESSWRCCSRPFAGERFQQPRCGGLGHGYLDHGVVVKPDGQQLRFLTESLDLARVTGVRRGCEIRHR